MTHMEQPDQATNDTAEPPRILKKRLRTQIRRARAERPLDERRRFAAELAAWEPPTGTRRVSCFVGVEEEPDTGPLLAALCRRGIEVILPITLKDFSLDWAIYTGDDGMAPAGYGLMEPTGERLGVTALSTVDVGLIPALAVDGDGRRLGQGAGCYDRALTHVPPGIPLLAIVYPSERLTDPLPEEPHDRRVNGVLP